MGRNHIDLTGQVFGRLTVLSYSHYDKKNRSHFYNCICICGNTGIIDGYALRNGTSRSCGCLRREIFIERLTTHGLSEHPLYFVCVDMNNRCNNPNNDHYKYYGGRGITVCIRWHRDNPEGLQNFITDMYPTYKPGLEIERIDNDGDYSPSNCRWATRKEQNNNKRNNRLVTLPSGETLTISQLSERTGIKYTTLYRRIFIANWPIEKALSIPVKKGK